MLDEGFSDYCLHNDSAYKPYWELVIEQNPDQQETFMEARQNILMLSGNLPEQEILLQIEQVKGKINAKTPGEESSQPYDDIEYDRKRISIKKLFLYAAAACIIFFAGSYFLFPFKSTPQEHRTDSFITVYNSVQGERKKIQLPDGSTVLLNTNSQLAINSNYNQHTREVELKGEAFFAVAKNAERPFIVHSNNFSTTAVGTEFYVHARNTEKEYKVDLLEGKVKLNNAASTLMLTPGEDAVWNNTETKFLKSAFDAAFLQQWITGKISFNKTSLKDAVEILKKWYAVDIEIKNKKLLDQSVNGNYSNATLEDILKVISFTFSCKYTYVNNTVTIQ